MKSRFKPEVDSDVRVPAKSIDIEFNEYELSEGKFTASVTGSLGTRRFIVQDSQDDPYPERSKDCTSKALEITEECADGHERRCEPEAIDSSWRKEVTAKLSNYKARRRPREPRYPSLQLKFEDREWAGPVRPEFDRLISSSQNVQLTHHTETEARVAAAKPDRKPATAEEVQPPLFEATGRDAIGRDATARIIEFPRSSNAPPVWTEELAEPVFDRPRIIEAPEISPPLPALRGISIEAVEAPANEKRPGFEMPLQSAKMARRLAATVIDAAIVTVSTAVFACIFWRLTAVVPALRLSSEILAALTLLLWSSYQYLLIVYCGTSPGLKLTKLHLSRFDGATAPRKLRRWRVLASMLSGFSLGLGYAWCFLDEDRLCWHDRITRTYMAPKSETH